MPIPFHAGLRHSHRKPQIQTSKPESPVPQGHNGLDFLYRLGTSIRNSDIMTVSESTFHPLAATMWALLSTGLMNLVLKQGWECLIGQPNERLGALNL